MEAFGKLAPEAWNLGRRDVAEPRPSAGDALVRVAACGICGSDLHAAASDPGFEWISPPVTLGHEFAGVVEAVGPEASGIEAGQHVVATSIQGCLRCDTCRAGTTNLCADRRIVGLSYDGGLAELTVLPAAQLVPLPADLPLRTAALVEPLSVAVRATRVHTRIVPGDRVVVSGPGPIGLFSAQLAARAGAEVVVLGVEQDRSRRLALAERFGLRTATVGEGIDTRVSEALDGPPDGWIEASGAGAALLDALSTVRRGGALTLVALYGGEVAVNPTFAVRRELTFSCSYASVREDYVRAVNLLRRGAIEIDGLADPFPLGRAHDAFEAARSGEVVKPLVVVDDALARGQPVDTNTTAPLA
ncbi:zinc-dependent alcohol dehydrogenase [Egibacter rhizosphaerae]|nr:alcohol dehydrogenase catalytic domain-containing protein [Egibacter rhizosphaerae]